MTLDRGPSLRWRLGAVTTMPVGQAYKKARRSESFQITKEEFPKGDLTPTR
jgi:hypothetical protein